MFLGSYVINDFKRLNKTEILKKVKESTRFSLSFITLLIGSSIVCTLGLLLNSTAVVIGGMIISPLMWPLMQTSLGISYGREEYIRRALFILFVATAISLITATLITLVSPIKILNAEILSRTNPTLIDIVIALVAGGVASLAITQPKISESLAGVAIATSLIPPLCVSGIGLALANLEVFSKGLLLYATNIVSIIFISILVFLWLGIANKSEEEFQKRALGVTGVILLLIAIPLFILLRKFTINTIAISTAENVLQNELALISKNTAFVSSIDVSETSDGGLLVQAEVLLPENVQINFSDRQEIQESLENHIGTNIDLRLRLQNTISVLSKSDLEYEETKKTIENLFIGKLSELKPSLSIDTLEIYRNEADQAWIISGVLIGEPTTTFTESDLNSIETTIQEGTEIDVLLSLEIVPRIKIQSDVDTELTSIRQDILNFLNQQPNVSSIVRIDVMKSSGELLGFSTGAVEFDVIASQDDSEFYAQNSANSNEGQASAPSAQLETVETPVIEELSEEKFSNFTVDDTSNAIETPETPEVSTSTSEPVKVMLEVRVEDFALSTTQLLELQEILESTYPYRFEIEVNSTIVEVTKVS